MHQQIRLTYPQFLLQVYSLSDCSNNIVREVDIASKIERLQLFKLLKCLEDFTHAFDVYNRVVFESHLHKVFPLFQISQDALRVRGVNLTILRYVAESPCKK